MTSRQRARKSTELLALCAWIKQAKNPPLSMASVFERVKSRSNQLAEELSKAYATHCPLFPGTKTDVASICLREVRGNVRGTMRHLASDATSQDIREQFGPGTYYIEARDASGRLAPGGRTIVFTEPEPKHGRRR